MKICCVIKKHKNIVRSYLKVQIRTYLSEKTMKNLIKRIYNWIVSIPKDKLLHDYAGELIAMFSFAILFRFLPFWWVFGISNAIALLFLIGKEIYDSKHHGEQSAEIADILWGIFGAVKWDIAALILFL